MRISKFTVNRPVFTSMFCLIALMLGAIALWRLPVDFMPDISYPTLRIYTRYENASPEAVEDQITKRIEGSISTIPGIKSIYSISGEGYSQISVFFNWGTDIETAVNDLRDRLSQVERGLPDEAGKPGIHKYNPSEWPVMVLGATGSLEINDMLKLIEERVKYRLERLPSVAIMNAWGGRRREIKVTLDIDKIKALGIPLNRIISRIKESNLSVPAGNIKQGVLDVRVRIPGTYKNLRQLGNTIIESRNNTVVHLRDIAKIEDSFATKNYISRINGKPGVRMAVYKASGANTVKVAEEVLKEIDQINSELTQVKIVPLFNSADYIKSSIRNLGMSILYGSIFALLVLLFFLRDWRSTAIIATAIPLSVVSSFALMYFAGLTLNIMTLGGLALGVGMLVDNAIVVLENIVRKMEGNISKYQAAVEGSEEVTSSIIASTLTTMVVFLPLILIEGMAGIMFKQLSIVVAFSLFCSLVSAIMLVPMLATAFLSKDYIMKLNNPSQISGLIDRTFFVCGRIMDAMTSAYSKMLHTVIHHRIASIVITIILGGAVAALVPLIGTEQMPATDEGEVRLSIYLESGTDADTVDAVAHRIVNEIKNIFPEITTTAIYTNGSRAYGSLKLLPMGERSRSSEDIAESIRERFKTLPGIRVYAYPSRSMFKIGINTGGEERVSMDIRGEDMETAYAVAKHLEKKLEEIKGISGASISRSRGVPEELLIINREKAEKLHLSVSSIAASIRTALGSETAGNYREGGREYAIEVSIKGEKDLHLRDILDLSLSNDQGEIISLRNIVSIESRMAPERIIRKDQERIVSVRASIYGRDMGAVIADVKGLIKSTVLPDGLTIVYTGEYEEQQQAFRELLLSFVLAFIMVYMVMACQFESLLDPFVVMFSVPFAGVGVLLVLFLTKTTFNIQSFIGCIMLTGIVVNNAILLIDHANHLRLKDGLPAMVAIEAAGRHRLRPVLMTAATTILGLLPLAFALGEGGEAQAPLARVVIGGLSSSTFITLLLLPVLYSFFERRKSRELKL